MSPRIALYARVSTTQQVATQTIEQQLTRMLAHVEQQGWGLADNHIFRDEGRSGSTLQRPGLDRLRDIVRLAEVDLVLVASPDRLARNYVHQISSFKYGDFNGPAPHKQICIGGVLPLDVRF